MVGLRGSRNLMIGVLAAGVLAVTASTGQTTAREWARAVLERSGVRGGLVVHAATTDGARTAALHAAECYVVQGLVKGEDDVAAARDAIAAAGACGPVSIRGFSGTHLPFADGLVNLLVVENGAGIPPAEQMRVLAPGGIALQADGRGGWRREVRQRPADIDEWTHVLYDATNNAVSRDGVVGPPRRLRWVAAPRWARSHEHQGSVSVVVSSGGRVFYIVDEGPTASVTLPADWRLVARDAFNGVKLWERRIPEWVSHLRPFRSGPAHLPRRLVAVGDRVYVTLGFGAPVTALDGATGTSVHIYKGTENASEIVVSDGVLYVVTAQQEGAGGESGPWRWGPPWRQKRLLALRAADGTVVWRADPEVTRALMPLTLAVGGDRVLFHTASHLRCLNAADGREQWCIERQAARVRPAWSTPTLVVRDGVVLCADRLPRNEAEAGDDAVIDWVVSHQGGGAAAEVTAYALADGRRLWSAPCSEGYNVPPDVFVANGRVWVGELIRSRDPGFLQARNLVSGEVAFERPPDSRFFQVRMGHHRCYRNRATERYLILGRAGVEFIDTQTGEGVANHWVRGTCQYGIMPANGLLYAPPHSCACHIDAKLNGFNALDAGPVQVDARLDADSRGRLVRGAQAAAVDPNAAAAYAAGDWPTYRRDESRSGATPTRVTAPAGIVWQTTVGGHLSAPVCVGNTVVVAGVDDHVLQALSRQDGMPLWRFTAAGRIDSPPTVYRELVIFGSADGHVYCLRLADGALVWRFRAAPQDRQIMSYGQLESAWPVHGSILVSGGAAYVVAGRSGFLDGGIHLYRLEPETGTVLTHRVLDSRDPATGGEPTNVTGSAECPRALPDVLSADAASVFMRHLSFSRDELAVEQPVRPHVWSVAGFLDDDFWHRSYWMFGPRYVSGWGGWWRAGNQVPAGRLLVFNEAVICGFGRSFMPSGNAGQWFKGEAYRLFATEREFATESLPEARGRGRRGPEHSIVRTRWSGGPGMEVRAMVLAGDTLYVAGPAGMTHRSLSAFQGREGVVLKAVSVADGSVRGAWLLPAGPVFDGLIAARGRLLLSLDDGTVVSLGGSGQPLAVAEAAPLVEVNTRPMSDDAPRVVLPTAREHPEFPHIEACCIGPQGDGYRLVSDSRAAGMVLRDLPEPMTGKVTLEVHMQSVAGAGGGRYGNGFLVFGDGLDPQRLVICGVRIKMGQLELCQGTLGEGTIAIAEVPANQVGRIAVQVTVDTDSGTVAAATGDGSIAGRLRTPVRRITHVGYCLLNAATDFGKVEIRVQ